MEFSFFCACIWIFFWRWFDIAINEFREIEIDAIDVPKAEYLLERLKDFIFIGKNKAIFRLNASENELSTFIAKDIIIRVWSITAWIGA